MIETVAEAKASPNVPGKGKRIHDARVAAAAARVIDTGTGWKILVDGIVRGSFSGEFAAIEAVREARKWGF